MPGIGVVHRSDAPRDLGPNQARQSPQIVTQEQPQRFPSWHQGLFERPRSTGLGYVKPADTASRNGPNTQDIQLFGQGNVADQSAHQLPRAKRGGEGWIRTSVRETRADLQSAAFNHSATSPRGKARQWRAAAMLSTAWSGAFGGHRGRVVGPALHGPPHRRARDPGKGTPRPLHGRRSLRSRAPRRDRPPACRVLERVKGIEPSS